jgi:hypothetical protein
MGGFIHVTRQIEDHGLHTISILHVVDCDAGEDRAYLHGKRRHKVNSWHVPAVIDDFEPAGT